MEISFDVMYQTSGSADNSTRFSNPIGIAASEHGVFVADGKEGRLFKFSHDLQESTFIELRVNFESESGLNFDALGDISYPSAVCVTSSSLVLVSIRSEGSGWSDELTERVLVFNTSLDYLGNLGEFTRTDYGKLANLGEINDVSGIACNGDDQIYLVELGNHRVQVFSPIVAKAGGISSYPFNWWGGFIDALSDRIGNAPGDWAYPLAIAILGDRVAIADSFKPHIHWFNVEGDPEEVWDLRESEFSVDQEISSLAILPSGHTVYSDIKKSYLLVLSSSGQPLGFIGGPGMKPGQFLSPRGLAVGSNGLLYVADTGNLRIQALKLHFE